MAAEAVVLMAYGSPDRLEDVPAYYADIRGGRTVHAELLDELVEHGDDAVARTREQLDVLREAGVVDAGAAGLVELLRGLAASLAGRPARGERLLRLVSADE